VDKWIDLVNALGPYVLGLTGLLIPLAMRSADRKHQRELADLTRTEAKVAERDSLYVEVLRLTKGMTTLATIIQRRDPSLTPTGDVVDQFTDDGRELRAISGRMAALASPRVFDLYDEAVVELMDFVLIARLAKGKPEKALSGWGTTSAAEVWAVLRDKLAALEAQMRSEVQAASTAVTIPDRRRR
jgi:hypothetical protein